MAVPGPPELGRGVVVLPGVTPPSPWKDSLRVVVDQSALREPDAVLTTLQHAWFERRPVVVELGIDPSDLLERETFGGPVHDLSPHFEFRPGAAALPRVGQQL